MGVHHDNFDLWDSKYTRWNAVNMGPKKDVVGMWQKAARKQGLALRRERALWISYKWFAVSHGADKTGPLAGVPMTASIRSLPTFITMPIARGSSTSWTGTTTAFPNRGSRHYLDRMTDLIDKYQPDLLYTDGHLAVRGLWAEDGGASLQRERAIARRSRPKRSTPAKKARIARSAPACWIMSAAFPTASRRIRGRPIPALGSGTTSAARIQDARRR